MPTINSAGTYTKDNVGLSKLAATNKLRAFTFDGTATGDTLDVQYLDDEGTFRDLENGDVAAVGLPRSFELTLDAELQIVTTGSPDFQVTISVS